MTPGIHLIHKPVGPTSFSLLLPHVSPSDDQKAAGNSSQKRPKICHGGTLDPFASGLLLVLVEPANRLFDHLHSIPKTYEATILWGAETDNGDPHGRVIFTGDSSGLSEVQLEDSLKNFIGWRDQIPHATSAKRIAGERAYLKAHRGEDVIMPSAQVYLHEAKWLGHDLPRESRLRLVVRGGYYVRALARDLGRALGCGAHLTGLHRTAIGPWNDPGPEQTVELHGRELLPWCPVRILTDRESSDLRQRRDIPPGELLPARWTVPSGFPDPQGPIRGFHADRLRFLLREHEGQLKLLTVLGAGL